MLTSLLVALACAATPSHQQLERIGDFVYVPRQDIITDEDTSYIVTSETSGPPRCTPGYSTGQPRR